MTTKRIKTGWPRKTSWPRKTGWPRKTSWMIGLVGGLIVSGGWPTVAQAETNSLTHLFPALVGVQLTSTQQAQLTTLTEQTLPQVQNLLNPEQQTQFKAALNQGQGVRAAALSLNLTIAQRFQLNQLLRPLRSQLNSILTPAQQQQVQQNVKALQQQGR
jgi:LTXXQ motif family protein